MVVVIYVRSHNLSKSRKTPFSDVAARDFQGSQQIA